MDGADEVRGFRMQWARFASRTIRSGYGAGVCSQGAKGSLESCDFNKKINLRAASK